AAIAGNSIPRLAAVSRRDFCRTIDEGLQRRANDAAPTRQRTPDPSWQNGPRAFIPHNARSPFGRSARGSKQTKGLRGVGEHSEGWNSISGSADDTMRTAAPCSRADRVTAGPICTGANSYWPREDQASVSPTPSVADPGVTTDRIAVSRVMSPG